MPIYAYKCTSCGQSKDVLQKISDAQLTVCPFCGEATFAKQVTAAGFQLKGSGWYVTDFRGGNAAGGAAAPAEPDAGAAKAETKDDAKAGTKGDPKPAEKATGSSEGSAPKKAEAPSAPSAPSTPAAPSKPSTGTTGSGS